jgi:mRNA deadenylase 3'-5' endonuclease subunit Ccr4
MRKMQIQNIWLLQKGLKNSLCKHLNVLSMPVRRFIYGLMANRRVRSIVKRNNRVAVIANVLWCPTIKRQRQNPNQCHNWCLNGHCQWDYPKPSLKTTEKTL